MASHDSTSERFPRTFGKYHLLGPLAEGGMGALSLAVTGGRGLEKLLVIKTVLPHLADAEYVARFRDEAKVVVRLSHGNLIPVFDAGQVEGELFVAMDFVEGKDLRAVWNRCAKKAIAFPVEVAVYIVKELCRGLGYAHAYEGLELVHRDVSPPNVILSYSGEVKLTDFGLASSTLKLEKTAPGVIYGKVAYMSPEQARGDVLDARSDMYAAGIILWELLTGRQLFPPGSEQPKDLVERARDPRVQPPSERAPRVSPELDAVVLKALAPDPSDRFESCKALRDALNEWLAVHSPSTDASTLEAFAQRLFGDEMISERQERRALIDRARERAQTLAPTDELRLLLGDIDERQIGELKKAADRRRDEGPNEGRRATDQGDESEDRRQSLSRRLIDKTFHGVAVDLASQRPGERAAVGGALAAELEADAPSLIGRVIDGRYRIDELIGEGGMGRVYLAEHVDIGKRVAVKVLHPVYGRMPDLVERFRREARAASRIGHPNIVDVTDSGSTDDGSVYFVMECLQGVELAAVIHREGALDIERTLLIGSQICRALSAAHAGGIIHRDLKPENIFLTHRDDNSDFVKVLDFGIAKSTEAEEARTKRLTHPGMAMGTPEYMAPEQAAGKPADARCDVYAVGAILYEMLTGAAPYQGQNFMEILTKKATVEPRPPLELRPDIPPEVADLVMEAMARDPGARPASMAALEYELTKCIAGRGAAVAGILGMRSEGSPAAGRKRRESDAGTTQLIRRPRRVGALRQRRASDDEVKEQLEVPDLRGAGLRMLGWTFFCLMLLAGAAAVFVVAYGERRAAPIVDYRGVSAAPPSPAGDSAAEVEAAGAESKPLAARPLEIEAVTGDPADSTGVAAPSPRGDPAGAALAAAGSLGDEGTSEEAPPLPDRAARRSGTGAAAAVGSRKEASSLLFDAKRHVARLEWEEARKNYRRVAASSYYKAQAELGLAEVAFQTQNHDLAISHARRAGGSPEARMILGNALYRKGDYKGALGAYEVILREKPGHNEAKRAAERAREAMSAVPGRR